MTTDKASNTDDQPSDRPLLPAAGDPGDDAYQSTGPAGWACSPRLGRWAAWINVHGSGGHEDDYRLALKLTWIGPHPNYRKLGVRH